MTFKNLIVKKEDGLGIITINRPSLRNALNFETLQEIEGILNVWREDSEIDVVIFTGAGEKSFAAGADISQLNQRSMIEALRSTMSGIYRQIETYEKPTIAAINGFALGGGLELALACDIRIAAKGAKLGLPELNLGIMPGAGGTQRLSRIVGKGKTLEMILTGDAIDATKAERIGLVTCVAEREELMQVVAHYAEKIRAKGPLAVRLAKTVIHKGADVEMDVALLLEKYAQTILTGSEDKNEGTAAFLEKRPPRFKGK